MIWILGWLVCCIITWLRIYQYQTYISLFDVIVVLFTAPVCGILAIMQFLGQLDTIILIKKKP